MALFVANTISYTGNMLTLVTIPWFVLQTTGSAVKTGLAGFFAALPLLLAGIFGGALVDRLGYKRSSVLSDLVSAITVALVPLLFTTIGLTDWQLLLLVFLRALLNAPGDIARQSMLPDLAQLGDISFEQANAAFDTTRRVAGMVGAPVAGVLIAFLGASRVLWLDATTFAASAALIGMSVSATKVIRKTNGHYLNDLRAGFVFIRQEHYIRAFIVIGAMINVIGAPFFAVVLPVYANTVFGSAVALGFMTAGAGAGALIGAILFGMRGKHVPRRVILVGVGLLTALRYGTLAVMPSLAVSIAVIVIVGISFGPLNPLIDTLVQEHTPMHIRGRVFGMIGAIDGVSIPLGILLGGYGLETFGLQAVLLAQSVLSMAVAMSALVHPAFRGMDVRQRDSLEI
jgi:MFS family permease